MTNAEAIRNMTDEELVEVIYHLMFVDCSDKCDDFHIGCVNDCKHDLGKDYIRKWLEEDVE